MIGNFGFTFHAAQRAERQGLSNVVPALAHGNDCGLPAGILNGATTFQRSSV